MSWPSQARPFLYPDGVDEFDCCDGVPKSCTVLQVYDAGEVISFHVTALVSYVPNFNSKGKN